MKAIVYAFILLSASVESIAQKTAWQQKVKYTMNIRMDVDSNRFSGNQELQYWNNSPDTLHKIFYHLYWNAFQPGSMMDERSRHMGTVEINGRPDWDSRVRDRILHLDENEIGYQQVLSLTMNGVAQPFEVQETILEVNLTKPILPNSRVTLKMDFKAQVPLQVRRAGRDAANGVQFSMSQWYPKLCAYDEDGWHPNPYIAREFYGVWGDYDVKISIDKKYILGGTGDIQNPGEVGHGYELGSKKVSRPAGEKLVWHFNALNVHDFVWAADTGYTHLTRKIPFGPTIHVLYKSGDDLQWKEVADAAVSVYPFITANFGAYPYSQYSFIQGGDGGMEYPMATLLNGPGLGTAIHEWMHSWYQMMLATDESRYAWMDEGFTEWATNLVQHHYNETVVRKRSAGNASALQYLDSLNTILPKYHADNYAGYLYLARSRREEPLTTHADHFESNFAYGQGAYSKGCVFIAQLGYITGDSTLKQIMLRYYNEWRFRHPDAGDFIRVAEKVSGLQLDWYQEYFINTTKTIDYAIDSLWEEGGKTKIRLRKLGAMPMPLDVSIEYKDGTRDVAYIPAYMMFGGKDPEGSPTRWLPFPAWKWTSPTYIFELDKRITSLKTIEIDASYRLADMERRNNKLVIPW